MTSSDQGRPVAILLVDDNETDVLLAREALEQAKVHNEVHVVSDGAQALEFLRRQGPYAKAQRPDLVLLDLNLPVKDGREVLAEMKADPLLVSIPVVIMTTSHAESDIAQAYGLHANCYVVKPLDFARFAEVVRSINQFWFTVVALPATGN